jgi:hypothetical protein
VIASCSLMDNRPWLLLFGSMENSGYCLQMWLLLFGSVENSSYCIQTWLGCPVVKNCSSYYMTVTVFLFSVLNLNVSNHLC